MTYQSKRARDILAATTKPQDTLSSQSPTRTTTCTSFSSEAASQPTKKRAMQSPLSEALFGKNLLLDQHQVQLRKLLKTCQTTRKKNQSKPTSMMSPNMPPNIPHSVRPDSLNSRSTSYPTTQQPLEHPQPLRQGFQNLETGAAKTLVAASQDKQTWKKSGQESKEIPKKSKSLREKSLPDWPQNIDFDNKEEVLTIFSGTILPINVWSNNGVKYFVEFNDLCQPIRKGGHILIRFIGMMAKMETHCPVGEEDWHAIDSHIKGKIVKDIRDRFVIPYGAEYDKQALKRANKAWRQYRFSLKKEYYKPKEKTLDEMCSQVPPSGISSNNWIKLVKYWHSEKGKNLSECGKKARAFLNQYHRSGSNSYANQQADYEDEHGEKMSLLALSIKSHTGKDGSFLSGTDTNDFVDDVNAKVEQLRLKYPTKSQLELENEAFKEIMYQDEIPDRPIGYGLGVKKGNIYGVHGVLRKEGYGKIQRNIEKEKLKDQVQENNILFKTLIGQFSQVVSAVRQEKSSPELLNCTQELLGMAHQ
ncbi:Alpha-2-macroglobulin, partial [Bienertia sinuspersici]